VELNFPKIQHSAMKVAMGPRSRSPITDFAVRGYLEQHDVSIIQSYTIGVQLSQADWAGINSDSTDNLDESLRQIRGIGFFMAMIGAIGDG